MGSKSFLVKESKVKRDENKINKITLEMGGGIGEGPCVIARKIGLFSVYSINSDFHGSRGTMVLAQVQLDQSMPLLSTLPPP